MTEEEWFAATTTAPLLAWVEQLALPRKLRLFMVGVCRRGWDQYGIPAIDRVLATGDRFADGRESEGWVSQLRRQHSDRWFWGLPVESVLCERGQEYTTVDAFLAAIQNRSPPNLDGAYARESWVRDEQLAVARILRDTFAPPSAPQLQPVWCTDTVVALARQMYDSREFGAMPILADALQDAGCEDEAILNHCRDANQPHVRGCWVCDLVLSK